MRTSIKTPPLVEPVSLASAKLHCRIDGTDEDALITAAIAAARQAAEHSCGRRLIDQTWYAYFDAWAEFEYRSAGAYAGPALVLHGLAPVKSVAAITYVDPAGVSQSLAGTEWALMAGGGAQPPFIVQAFGKSWPAARAFPEAIRVEAVCGYGAAESDVPESIRAWILLVVGAMYENREIDAARALARLPFADSLLDPFRIPAV